MFVSHRDLIEKKQISEYITKQVLVGPKEGWKDHVMRMFTLEKGGKAPRHSHPWQHIIYAVEGKGNLYMEGKDYPLKAGSWPMSPMTPTTRSPMPQMRSLSSSALFPSGVTSKRPRSIPRPSRAKSRETS